MELTTSDGLTIGGTWQAAVGVTHGPGVLLLHQVDAFEGEGHDRYDWSGTFDPLVEAGITVLAIDFRSHGLSDPADIPVIDLGSDREQLRYDVQAGLSFLRGRDLEVSQDQIGVAGLGLGGTMAAVAANQSGDLAGDWGVRGLAVVSGRHDRAQDLNPDGDTTLSLPLGGLRSKVQLVVPILVAASSPGVTLVDLEAAASDASEGGIPGYDLFWDYCHMRWQGYAAMAHVVMNAMLEGDLLPEEASGPLPPLEVGELADQLDSREQAGWLDRARF